jgi:hypothetical protein
MSELKRAAFGRKRALTPEDCKKIRLFREEDKYSVPQLAKRFHVGPATIYRALQDSVQS